eukprot:1015118-Amphidinium_carterae.1
MDDAADRRSEVGLEYHSTATTAEGKGAGLRLVFERMVEAASCGHEVGQVVQITVVNLGRKETGTQATPTQATSREVNGTESVALCILQVNAAMGFCVDTDLTTITAEWVRSKPCIRKCILFCA